MGSSRVGLTPRRIDDHCTQDATEMQQDMLDLVLIGRTPNPMVERSLPPAAVGAATATGPQSCPVDHKSREAWLEKARASNAGGPGGQHQQQPPPPAPSEPPKPTAAAPGWTWRVPFFGSSTGAPLPADQPSPPAASAALGTGRVVSSIPRSSSPGPSSCPVNHEVETGSDGASGNWIYPSEKMFFDAMRRKGHDSARPADMKTVVPIHNAVNERAWAEIKAWEAPYTGSGEGQ